MFSLEVKILNFGKTAFVKINVFFSRCQHYIHKNLICGTNALEGPVSKSAQIKSPSLTLWLFIYSRVSLMMMMLVEKEEEEVIV